VNLKGIVMTMIDIRPVGAEGASNEVASVVALLSEPPVDAPGVLERLRGLQTIAKKHPPRCDDDGLACFNYGTPQ
jgi:hypothetical protein